MQRDLALVKPTRKYASQVMHYKQEMLANNDSLDGCAGLEDTDSFDEWIDFDNRLKKKYGVIKCFHRVRQKQMLNAAI